MVKTNTKEKRSPIIDFNVYQLINRETGQRTYPALMVGNKDLGILGMLDLLSPKKVKKEYKDKYITQNWYALDVFRILKFTNGKVSALTPVKVIALKDIGEVNVKTKKPSK